MLCSRCNRPVVPVVAIDIDGTLGNYHAHFSTFAAGYFGRPEPRTTYGGAEPYLGWFTRRFGVEVAEFRAAKLAYRQGGMKRTMPVYPGAKTLVSGLRAAGAEVWLTTTRPHDRYDRVDPDTREWLGRNGIEFDGLLYSGDKVEELYKRVGAERVVAVLDDETEQLRTALRFFGGGATLLRRTTYNRDALWPREAVNLAEAGEWIESKINHYKETHDDVA